MLTDIGSLSRSGMGGENLQALPFIVYVHTTACAHLCLTASEVYDSAWSLFVRIILLLQDSRFSRLRNKITRLQIQRPARARELAPRSVILSGPAQPPGPWFRPSAARSRDRWASDRDHRDGQDSDRGRVDRGPGGRPQGFNGLPMRARRAPWNPARPLAGSGWPDRASAH